MTSSETIENKQTYDYSIDRPNFVADQAICDVRVYNSLGQYVEFTSKEHRKLNNHNVILPQLEIEFTVDDNADATDHNCTLTVYNLTLNPDKYNTHMTTKEIDENGEEVVTNVTHYAYISIYWERNPDDATNYTMNIDFTQTTSERSGADWKTVFKGAIAANILLKDNNKMWRDINERGLKLDGFTNDNSAITGGLYAFAKALDKLYNIKIVLNDIPNICSKDDELNGQVFIPIKDVSLYFIVSEYFSKYCDSYGYRCVMVDDTHLVFYKTYQQLKPLSDNESNDNNQPNTKEEEIQNASMVMISRDYLIKYKRANRNIEIECYGLPKVKRGGFFIIDYGEDWKKNNISKQKLSYQCSGITMNFDQTSGGWYESIQAVCTEDPEPAIEAEPKTAKTPDEAKIDIDKQAAPQPLPKVYVEKLLNYYDFPLRKPASEINATELKFFDW